MVHVLTMVAYICVCKFLLIVVFGWIAQGYQWMLSLWRSCSSLAQSICGRYCVQRFAAVIMRIREPKTTALIFASGKMVLLGFNYDTPLLRVLWIVEFHMFSCRNDAFIWHAFSHVIDSWCASTIAIFSGVHRCQEWATVKACCQKGVNSFAGFWNDRLLGLWIAPFSKVVLQAWMRDTLEATSL